MIQSRLKILLFYLLFVLSSCSDKKAKEQKTISKEVFPDSTEKHVLFVQWQYPQEVDFFDAMDVRHKLENKIDNALRSEGVGEWLYGDMGPGGANMGYGVFKNQSRAIEIILQILAIEKIEKNTVIATDLDYVDNKWAYKILYPSNYNKELNPL